MTVKIKDIIDEERFGEWLREQDVKTAQVLATRIALRSLPTVLQIHTDTNVKLSGDNRRELSLQVFRTNFILWFALSYPDYAISDATTATVNSTARAIREAVGGNLPKIVLGAPLNFVFDIPHYAGYAAQAALTAASGRTVSSGYNASHSASFGSLARSNIRSGADAGHAGLIVWKAIEQDCNYVIAHSIDELWSQPLWMNRGKRVEQGAVITNHQLRTFKHSEENREYPWGLWLAWYEGLLEDPAKSRFGEKADLEIAGLSDDDWSGDVKDVMAKLAEIVGWPFEDGDNEGGDQSEESLDEEMIPGQKPAPVEVVFQDAKITRVHSAPVGDGQDLLAIHRILRNEANWLGQRLGGQMPDAAISFDNLATELGSELEHVQIYGVGYWANILSALEARVDEGLMDDAAARFAGFMVNLDLFLKQSADWNAYVKTAQLAELENLSDQEGQSASRITIEEIGRVEELVDISVFEPLDALNKVLADAPVYNPETAYGFYRSLANVLQVVAQVALKDGPEKLKSFALDVGGDINKNAVSYTAKAIILTIGGALSIFALKAASMFGFLTPILRMMGIV